MLAKTTKNVWQNEIFVADFVIKLVYFYIYQKIYIKKKTFCELEKYKTILAYILC